jgi:uncharacterized membrane protein YdfJ with MMPL/SSD domain
VLAALPLVMPLQVGILVAVGVLIDTVLVRSIVVPALTMSLRFADLVAQQALAHGRGPG